MVTLVGNDGVNTSTALSCIFQGFFTDKYVVCVCVCVCVWGGWVGGWVGVGGCVGVGVVQ